MKRTDPNFKSQELIRQEDADFIDEMFDELFGNLLDSTPIDSDTDEVPNLEKQMARFGKPHP